MWCTFSPGGNNIPFILNHSLLFIMLLLSRKAYSYSDFNIVAKCSRRCMQSWIFVTAYWTRIWHLAQINNHVEVIMRSITLGTPGQPNSIEHHIWWSKEGFSCYSISKGRKYITSISRIFSNTNATVAEATIDNTTMQDYNCCLQQLELRDGTLKLDNPQPSLSLEIIGDVTYARHAT